MIQPPESWMQAPRDLWKFELFEPSRWSRAARLSSGASIQIRTWCAPDPSVGFDATELYDTTIIPRALCRQAPSSFR